MHRARWGPLVTNPASKPADLDVVVYENAWSSLSLLALALVVFARIAFLKNQRHLSLKPACSRVLEKNRALLGAEMDFLCSEPRTVWACVSPSTGPEARQRFTHTPCRQQQQDASTPATDTPSNSTPRHARRSLTQGYYHHKKPLPPRRSTLRILSTRPRPRPELDECIIYPRTKGSSVPFFIAPRLLVPAPEYWPRRLNAPRCSHRFVFALSRRYHYQSYLSN
jgi:hypothetical protein